MKYVKIVAKLFAVLVLGGGVLLIFFNVYLRFFYHEDPLKDHILKNMDEDQTRLGIQCVDGDKLISDYLHKVKSSLKEVDKGNRLVGSEPIILQGENVYHAVMMCNRYGNLLEKYGLHTLDNVAMAEDAAVQEISIIRVSVSQTIPKWCHADCIQVARERIDENSALLEKRIRLKIPETKVGINK